MSLKEILKKLNDILKNDRMDAAVILAATAVEANPIDPDGAGTVSYFLPLMLDYKKNIFSNQGDSGRLWIQGPCSLHRLVFSCNVTVSL